VTATLDDLLRTPITLEANHVRLEPLSLAHVPDLFAVAQDEEIWRWLAIPPPSTADEMRAWVEEALSLQARVGEQPFAVIDRATGRAIGSTRLMNVEAPHRGLEIGWTWYGRAYWRTAVNTECKYLLLRHAFETLGCIRVQFRTDLRNERSQRAIERLGAVREGVLRKHRIVARDGYHRSSVCYSIIDDEWPAVKSRLEPMLAR
jgi:N-acetyltransferase